MGDGIDLIPGYSPIRWPEKFSILAQVLMDRLVGKFDFPSILLRRRLPATDMMKGVISDCMAAGNNLMKYFGMLLYIITNAKKKCRQHRTR